VSREDLLLVAVCSRKHVIAQVTRGPGQDLLVRWARAARGVDGLERLWTTETMGTTEGGGLGLAYCHSCRERVALTEVAVLDALRQGTRRVTLDRLEYLRDPTPRRLRR